MNAISSIVGAQLYQHWASMWNGRLELAQQIIAEPFVAHLTADALAPPQAIRDPQTVAAWVAFIRSRGVNLSYQVEVGPIVQDDLVVGYWRLAGLRIPPDGGSPLPFAKVGIDILRFRDNRLVECWTMNNNART
jgi:hypothetical protein